MLDHALQGTYRFAVFIETKERIMVLSELDFLDALNVVVAGHSYTPIIHESEQALVVEFVKGQKKISLTWPRNSAEVRFGFYLDSENVYDDRIVCSEESEKNDFIAQIRRVVDRFLNYEVKLSAEGTLLKMKDLKFQDGTGWHHVI
ncbi:MAG: hypothetical protein K8S27_09375 [Candidatus Omnitrophica bacterium]|nr:hypothetical protein [Candidatus Omnitrophota bacterium]